ncbi:MAG TPA: glycosyltransferase [Casimicrobiaceae bacterium]|nr:glycosyltransferase [Casimicrobiaceae bacterium]
MDVSAALSAALAAHRAGRIEDARRSAETVWQQTTAAKAAAFLALLELDAGNFDTALVWNDRAAAVEPGNAKYALQGARVAALMGDHVAAFDRLEALLQTAPQTERAWAELVAIAPRCERRAEAIACCVRAYDADPTLRYALRALLHLLPDEADAAASPPAGAAPAQQSISIVVCSDDDAQFAAMAASYERALGTWPHAVVRISGATSLAEGYTRGGAAAKGDIIVFSHDDVEILATDFGPRLLRRLAECDVLGIAGATRATAPAWAFAGWPFLHGSVIYPDATGYRVTVYSRVAPLARGIRVMDGVFLAMRREVAQRVGWDAQTCDGFHGYDVDFTLRAAQAGLRLAVASDLGVVHRSYGSFDALWEATAHKLIARHPELRGTRSSETGFVERSVPTARQAMALVDNWARLGSAG